MSTYELARVRKMTTKDTGGAAFPTDPNTQPGVSQHHHGMTLRDYFAAMQMNRIGSGWPNAENMARIAADCYAMADAMLAERSK